MQNIYGLGLRVGLQSSRNIKTGILHCIVQQDLEYGKEQDKKDWNYTFLSRLELPRTKEIMKMMVILSFIAM